MVDTKQRPIAEIEKEIAEEFALFDDPVDKLGFLMEQASEMETYPEEYRSEEYRVNGCTSRVWLHAELRDNRVYFQADSDAQIPKGLVAVLLRAVSRHTPQEIIDAKLSFIDEIGLRDMLSPNRASGLGSMIKHIKGYAIGLQSVQNRNESND